MHQDSTQNTKIYSAPIPHSDKLMYQNSLEYAHKKCDAQDPSLGKFRESFFKDPKGNLWFIFCGIHRLQPKNFWTSNRSWKIGPNWA